MRRVLHIVRSVSSDVESNFRSDWEQSIVYQHCNQNWKLKWLYSRAITVPGLMKLFSEKNLNGNESRENLQITDVLWCRKVTFSLLQFPRESDSNVAVTVVIHISTATCKEEQFMYSLLKNFLLPLCLLRKKILFQPSHNLIEQVTVILLKFNDRNYVNDLLLLRMQLW